MRCSLGLKSFCCSVQYTFADVVLFCLFVLDGKAAGAKDDHRLNEQAKLNGDENSDTGIGGNCPSQRALLRSME